MKRYQYRFLIIMLLTIWATILPDGMFRAFAGGCAIGEALFNLYEIFTGDGYENI